MEKKKVILPGNFGTPDHFVDADTRRIEFDILNEQIVCGQIKPDIVFIGDSITHYMEENRFYHKYGFVVNRGIGGDRSTYVKRRFMADVVQLEPRLCIMLIGCNNFWDIDDIIPEDACDFPEDIEKQYIGALEADYREMLDCAKEHGVVMWIASILPQCAPVLMVDRRNRFIVKVNKMLASLADEYGTAYVDYHSSMTREDGLTLLDGVSSDGLHPDSTGYELMSRVLLPMLDDYFGDN